MTRPDLEFLGTYLWLTVLLCLALLGISYLYYRRTTPPISGALRWVLLTLRSLAFAALFLSLAQPILSYSTITELKKRLAVLLDRSLSMALPLTPGADQRRIDKAEEILDSDAFSRLADDLDITCLAFAESLDVSEAGLNLSGATTNPGLAFRQLRQKSAVEPYDYVMILSDGRATEGENLVDLVGSFGRPVYTVAVGDSSHIDDIALADIEYNEVIFAGRQTEIKAVVSQQGNIEGKIQISLADGNRTLAQKADDPPGDGKTGEYSLVFTPANPGRLFLNLETTTSGREINRDNNRRTFAVRVLKSKLSILLYTSSLNEEYAFLNRYLAGREDYEVTRVIDARGGDRLGERFPTTQERLNSFDLVIMVDPDLSRLSSHYDRFVSYMTDRGGGVLLFMGERYAQSSPGSRIETLVPLAVAPARLQPVHYGKYHIEPNLQTIFHPVMKLADNREEIAAAWASQPPFTILLPIDSTRTGAVPLGYLDTGQQRTTIPLAAFLRYGAGKILAFAAAPFWHWAFYPVGVGGDPSIYQELLSSTIRWLTISDESDRLSFKPVKEVFESGEEVAFAGFVRDEGFRPIEGGNGKLIVTHGSGDSTVAAIVSDPRRPGGYQSAIGVLPPGTYGYRAAIFADSVRLGRFEGEFAVDDIDRETAFGDVDWTYLVQTADNSGGVFASYRNLAPILDAVDLEAVEFAESHEIRLWDHLVLLVVIIATLSAEWFIRKRKQLL